MNIGDYIIPKGTKRIEQIVDAEYINDAHILYTDANRSYEANQVESLDTVYERENPSRYSAKEDILGLLWLLAVITSESSDSQ